MTSQVLVGPICVCIYIYIYMCTYICLSAFICIRMRTHHAQLFGFPVWGLGSKVRYLKTGVCAYRLNKRTPKLKQTSVKFLKPKPFSSLCRSRAGEKDGYLQPPATVGVTETPGAGALAAAARQLRAQPRRRAIQAVIPRGAPVQRHP